MEEQEVIFQQDGVLQFISVNDPICNSQKS